MINSTDQLSYDSALHIKHSDTKCLALNFKELNVLSNSIKPKKPASNWHAVRLKAVCYSLVYVECRGRQSAFNFYMIYDGPIREYKCI